MKIEWTLYAIEDRNSIFDYIVQESPQAACNIDERIGDQIPLLADYPEAGREGRVAGTRELVISDTHHIAAYSVGMGTIKILRILHSAQNWPDDIPA